MKDWGLEDGLRKVAHESGEIKLRRWQDGEVIATQSRKCKRGQWWGLRNDLRRFLHEAAVESGAIVYFGRKARSVDLEGPAVTFEDGEVVRCDLLVGADGNVSLSHTKGELTIDRNKLSGSNGNTS